MLSFLFLFFSKGGGIKLLLSHYSCRIFCLKGRKQNEKFTLQGIVCRTSATNSPLLLDTDDANYQHLGLCELIRFDENESYIVAVLISMVSFLGVILIVMILHFKKPEDCPQKLETEFNSHLRHIKLNLKNPKQSAFTYMNYLLRHS